MARFTNSEKELLSELLMQDGLERVSPKMERFREPWSIKLAKGGRGAGAKSWGMASLLIQRANYDCIRIGSFREIQKSIEESSYQLLVNMVGRLRYPGWKITDQRLESPTGSKIIFRGLKDIRAAGQVKSLEDFDIFAIEEAAPISNESWMMLLPTLRKEGSELWAVYNQETDFDPVDIRLWNSDRKDVLRVWLEPGPTDNPWWTSRLQEEMEAHYKLDPDEAEHVWGGLPRKQGQKAVMSRVRVRGAMNRIIDPVGKIAIGCDVARFGDDRTVLYKRHGLKIIDERSFAGQDLVRTSNEIWDMANKDPSIAINVDDSGVGGGVTDMLRSWGAKVFGICNNHRPSNPDKYDTAADEQWFEFPVDEADIPNDPVLNMELTGRQYDYTKAGQKRLNLKTNIRKGLEGPRIKRMRYCLLIINRTRYLMTISRLK